MSRSRRNTLLTICAALTLAVAASGVVRDARTVGPWERVPESAVVVTPVTARRVRGPVAMGKLTRPSEPDTSASDLVGPAPREAAPRNAPTDRRRAAPARGGAAPRSVHVLRVPVPSALPADENVQWTMRPGARAEVISAYAGTVPARTEDSARAITVVTRVPARAAAGILPVGEAEFISDSISIIVPIELVVDRVRRVSVAPARGSFGAIAGQKLLLSVEVRNLGNSPDTVELVSELPSGWARAASQFVVLNPGERKVVALETKIPRTSGTTAAYPAVRARLGGEIVSTTTLPVQVEDLADHDRPIGPRLVVGSASAFGDSVASSAAFDFLLNGAISQGVSIIGRASFAVDEATLDRRALARTGTYLGGAFVSVRGPGWYGTAGNTGTTLSTLTGIGAFGRGVTGGGNRGRVSVTGMVADVPNGSGVQGGARADLQVQRSVIGIAASHFTDAGVNTRSVDAVGLVASTTPGAGFQLTGEAAWRQFNGGSGAGVAFGVERNTATDLLAFNFAHSPGGSEAYGRALRDISAVAGRRFGDRFAVQGNLFSSVDRPPVAGGEFKANGWAVSPRYALQPDLGLEVEVRRNAFSSSAAISSRDLTASVALRKVGGKVQWNAGLSQGSTSREFTVASAPVTVTTQRFGISGGGAVITPRAVLSIGADYSQSGSGSGFAPRQARLTLGASRLAPFSAPNAPIFRAEAEVTSWLGDQPAAVVARIGTEVQLPGEFTLTVDAERNPMIRPTTTNTPWIVALRLERGFTLGWATRTPTTRGAVFQDLNGNGLRDEGERGMPGVMVRRGGQTTMTDANGRYAMPGTDPVPLEIDPISLPQGVVAPSFSPTEGGRQLTFGLVPTGAIAVRLVPALDELGRRPESPLTELAVLARDERGAEWYLRADTAGMVRFDALPPGRYTFVPDFAGTTERLRQVGDPVILDVKPGENLPPLEVRFTVRPARLFNGGQGQTDQGRRRR